MDLLGLLTFNWGFFDFEIKTMFWKCFMATICALHMRTSLSIKYIFYQIIFKMMD